MAVRAWPATLELPSIDRRYIVSGLLAALAAAIVLVITQPPERTPILVAGSDLPAGTALGELDVAVRYVDSADGLVEGTSIGELGTWVLASPLNEGEPLLPSLLKPPQVLAAPNLIAITLEAEHAVLGRLASGDLVDVYLTTSGPPGEEPVTRLVANGVYVVEATVADDVARSGDVDILLAVDDDLAGSIAGAARSGGLDLVKVAP